MNSFPQSERTTTPYASTERWSDIPDLVLDWYSWYDHRQLKGQKRFLIWTMAASLLPPSYFTLLASANIFQMSPNSELSSSNNHSFQVKGFLGGLFPAPDSAASAAVWHTEPPQQFHATLTGPKLSEAQPIPPFLSGVHSSPASGSLPQVRWLVHRKPAPPGQYFSPYFNQRSAAVSIGTTHGMPPAGSPGEWQAAKLPQHSVACFDSNKPN